MEKDYNIKKLQSTDNGGFYQIDVKIPLNVGWIENVNFVASKDGHDINFKLEHVGNDEKYAHFSNQIYLETAAAYRFFFYFFVGNNKFYMNIDSEITNYLNNNKLGKLSVNFDTPDWAKGAIMYQIFVDRFNRGESKPPKEMPRRHVYPSFDTPVNPYYDENRDINNDFYGGDLKGITNKLDYIKSLGVDVIYLGPIMESQSNHRYDTADYEKVDPYCGTNEDLKKLCDEAHKLGMKVILDSVFNHTGNDSKYFNQFGHYDTIGACQDINSEYGKFYKKDIKNGRIYFYYWWCHQNLPVCDKESPEWRKYVFGEGGIIDQWFKLGIDGLRLDVADDLSDDFLENIRKAVKRNKEDGLIIGEVWKNPMRAGRGYLSSGKCLDSVMDYSLVDALVRYFKFADTYKLDYTIHDILNEYPKGTIETLMNFTSTHDISRALNIFANNDFNANDEYAWKTSHRDKVFDVFLEYSKKYKLSEREIIRGKELLEVYTYCVDLMPGIFSIFYGDEVGVQGYGNEMNRAPFPWKNMDQELLTHFRYLGNIRKENEFLRTANFDIVDLNQNYFMFERTSSDGDALVAVSRNDEDSKILIPSKYENCDKIYSLKKSNSKNLSRYGGIALIKK